MKVKRIITLSCLSLFSVGLLASSISLANLSKQNSVEVAEAWSLDVKPSVTYEYYSSSDGKSGSDLKNALAGFNTPKSKSYDWSRYEAADEAYDDSTSILSIYTRHNIKKSNHCGSYSWTTWNREHVYTQSAFPASSTDNHNIFACEGQINNDRGNKPFANLKDKGGQRVTVFGHVTDCYQTSTLFEPCDEAKGEVARACLYCSVYYGYDLNDIFDSINTALEWNSKYTVSPREIYRNNIVHGLQGNRNPFIDHPSYAQKIYGGPAYSGDDPVQPAAPVAATGVSLDKDSASINVNETLTLTATVLPNNATNRKVTWSSSNSNIASVSNGTVRGVSEGNATITVTTDDGGFTATCEVTVTIPAPVAVTGVTLNKSQTSVDIGSSVSLVATVVPSNASNKNVSWTSGNTSIATVNNGIVVGVAEGTTSVTVTTEDGGFTACCNVTVTKPGEVVHVESISLNETRKELSRGETFQLVVTFNPTNATNKDIVWSVESDDEYPSVYINSKGLVTATREGTSVVIATSVDGLKTAECTIVVKSDQPASKGCGGNVVASSIILSTLSVVGITLVLIIRHRRVRKNK